MSFEPVYNAHSRALILGTWPSPKSREMAFYYGHPQNRFWPMLAALTGEPVPVREDIEAKKQIILRHGLALWDTLESCTITGASDASIKDVVPNDIAALLAKARSVLLFLCCDGCGVQSLLLFQPLLIFTLAFFAVEKLHHRGIETTCQRPDCFIRVTGFV